MAEKIPVDITVETLDLGEVEAIQQAVTTHEIIDKFTGGGEEADEAIAHYVQDSQYSDDGQKASGFMVAMLHGGGHDTDISDRLRAAIERAAAESPDIAGQAKRVLELAVGDEDDLDEKLEAARRATEEWAGTHNGETAFEHPGQALDELTRKSLDEEDDWLDLAEATGVKSLSHKERQRKEAESRMEWLIGMYDDIAKGYEISENDASAFDEAVEVLRGGNYSDTTALRAIEAIIGLQEFYGNSTNPTSLYALLSMPPEKLSAVYRMESSDLWQNPLHDLLNRQDLGGGLEEGRGRITFASVMHRCTEGRFWRDDSARDERGEKVLNSLRYYEEETIASMPLSVEEYGGNSLKYHERVLGDIDHTLEALYLPSEMIDHYRRATFLRNRNVDGILNGWPVRDELIKTSRQVRRIGSENAKRLHDKIGMENIWAYTDQEVDSLLGLINQDPATIAHMQAGDVTVQMFDVRGDYNGAITNYEARRAHAKESGRTIRVEMRSAGDIYRIFARLKKLGIKPSTLVYDAHGKPGVTSIGPSWDRTNFHSGSTGLSNSQGNDIDIRETQLGRIVRDFMQPNRGIDSHDSQRGEKTIVLGTCSGDSIVDHESGEFVDSVAETVLESVGLPDDVSVFAGDGVLAERLLPDGALTFEGYDIKERPDSIGSITNWLKRGVDPLTGRVFVSRMRVDKFYTRKQRIR